MRCRRRRRALPAGVPAARPGAAGVRRLQGLAWRDVPACTRRACCPRLAEPCMRLCSEGRPLRPPPAGGPCMAVRATERRPRALPESAPRARQAHETGICAVREELYAQCFEEVRTPRHVRARALPLPAASRRRPGTCCTCKQGGMHGRHGAGLATRRPSPGGSAQVIRQVTVGCAERGLLLLRLRDEMRMTTAAYQARSRPRGARRTSAEGGDQPGALPCDSACSACSGWLGSSFPPQSQARRHARQCHRSSLPPAPPFASQSACKVF